MALEASLDATVGDAVEFAVGVRNAGSEPVELTFPSSQRVEVVVRDGGAAVWRWSEGRMFAQVVETVELDAGEEIEEVVRWEDPVSGEFEVVGSVVGTGVEARERVDVPDDT